MTLNVTNYYKTLTDKELQSDQQRYVNFGNRRIQWGEDNIYSIVYDDEDSVRSYEKHSQRIIGLFALNNNKGSFVSVGLDNIIQVSGNKVVTLEGHEGRILGLLELPDGRLLSASNDGTIRIWDINSSDCVRMFNAKIKTLSAIRFFNTGSLFSLEEAHGISIWDLSAAKILEMEGQSSSIHSVAKLNGLGIWFVRGVNEYPSIWSETDGLIHRFDFSFDLHEGYLLLEDNSLLIRSATGQISHWNIKGEKLGSHISEDKVSSLYKSLFTVKQAVKNKLTTHPNVDYYPHLRNFINFNDEFIPEQYQENKLDSKKTLSREVVLDFTKTKIKRKKLKFEDDFQRRKIWNFFNRPLFKPINTTLKNEIKVSRRSGKEIKESIEKIEIKVLTYSKKISIYKIVSLFMLAITAMIALPSYYDLVTPGDVDIVRALIPLSEENLPVAINKFVAILYSILAAVCTLFLLIFFSVYRKNISKKEQELSNIHILKTMLPAFSEVINEVKSYRHRLLSEVPVIADKEVFSGKHVDDMIQNKILVDLQATGLDECGIDKEDIIYKDHEAIILPSWSLIQDNLRRNHVNNKLNIDNELSFWGGSSSLIFAVQFIQYIFLTEDKIDVFTAYYDFLDDKCIGKEANAFFYKDVTNISKREVDREHSVITQEKTIPATEITLSVSSGEKICLTILNEESMDKLSEAVESKQNKNPDLVLEELEAQRARLINEEMDEDEKEDELKVLDSEISQAKLNMIRLGSEQSSNKANEAIKNIRKQIRNHKQDVYEQDIS